MERGKYTRKVVGHGQIVWDLLANNPGGLTMNDLTELAELTRAQVRKAFDYIRDIFANENEQPIIYIPGKHKNVYKLTATALETEDDLRRRISIWAIQIKRARTAIAQPAMAKFGALGDFKRLNRHMGVVEEDLADLLNHI
jgi:predicted transcriptional regulator